MSRLISDKALLATSGDVKYLNDLRRAFECETAICPLAFEHRIQNVVSQILALRLPESLCRTW